MADWCREEGVEIWGYCLMPNHVHLIAVPKTEDGLRRAIGEAHRRYTRRINFREQWRGYLWQGRFASFVMDEPYLLAAARYVELNPVRAKLVDRARAVALEQCQGAPVGPGRPVWSKSRPLLAMVGDWKAFLRSAMPEEELRDLREHGRTGRPLGSSAFLDRLETSCGSRFETAETRPKAKTTQAPSKKTQKLGNAPLNYVQGAWGLGPEPILEVSPTGHDTSKRFAQLRTGKNGDSRVIWVFFPNDGVRYAKLSFNNDTVHIWMEGLQISDIEMKLDFVQIKSLEAIRNEPSRRT